jgi:histidyl-tRNA synthetase
MTDLSPPRGSRDFLPQEKILRNSIVDTLRKTFEKYGFNPLETPALENFEVLSSKYAGGDEILKETYSLEDQGKRKLGLRYDLTVPLARVFASQKLALPFKRYQIASVWRDGPIKAGRYREFTQCDVDVIGVASTKQEAELIALTQNAFKALGLKTVVKVNSRKLLNGLLDYAGIPESKRIATILELDKLEKIGGQGVLKEMEKLLGTPQAKKTIELFEEVEREKSLRIIEGMGLNKEGMEGVRELNEFFDSLDYFGVSKDFVLFSPSLARGLNYYTGMVFEAFLVAEEDNLIKSSLAAGGRYDDMIGKFAGAKEKIPAVGISFGLDVISEILKEKSARLGVQSPTTIAKVLVVPFKNFSYGLGVTQELRGRGISTIVDLEGRGVSKNLDFANRQRIPFIVFCGEKEEKEGKVKLRDMNSGKEELLSLPSALAKLA